MASVIKLKRSSSAGAIPTASDLEVGEIALNLADGVIYSKDASSNVIRIGEAQLANTNAFITSVQSAERAALANTNSRIATVETNLTNQIASERAALANTNSAIAAISASSGGGLANTNSAISNLNTNLTATNTALRSLITTNATNLTKQIASERAALANTNSRIDGLSSTLSGDFLTKANPQSTGHFQHTGRATISTNLEVSGNTTIGGNLTVEGDVTYVSTTNIEVNDPLIKLAANNTVSDVVDTGFFALYDNSGTTNYAGLFRDASDGVFKLFRDSEAQPTTTVDTGATGYTLAQLDAVIDGGSF